MCVRPFRVFLVWFKKKKKSWAVFNPSLSFTGSVLSSLQSLDPFTFSLFQLGLVLWPSVFSDSVLRNLQGCILIYLFLFLRLVLRPFSL